MTAITPKFMTFAAGVIGIGAAGLALTRLHHFQERSDADSVLKRVRKDFGDPESVVAAWINSQPQVATSHYTGGLTKLENGLPVTYRFVASASPFKLINVQRDL